ncbi:MAG: TIGR03085 family metal-binding protein [Actinomycetota bacterium]|nr:TIGR03085 family metal-binding protein [Actinomycetota bacterium]
MTTMSRTERAALCDVALQLGEAEPTLSGDWTVKDLVVHLLLRESSPAAVGIVVPRLSGLTDAAASRMGKRDFTVLVERLRSGPPIYSPYGWGRLEKIANTLEFFVHHEDIRRAQPSWEPRRLSSREQSVVWKAIRVAGKPLVRSSDTGVILERVDTGERATLRPGTPTVVLRGLPGEVALYVFGRKDQAQVELDGPGIAVAALRRTDLGL